MMHCMVGITNRILLFIAFFVPFSDIAADRYDVILPLVVSGKMSAAALDSEQEPIAYINGQALYPHRMLTNKIHSYTLAKMGGMPDDIGNIHTLNPDIPFDFAIITRHIRNRALSIYATDVLGLDKTEEGIAEADEMALDLRRVWNGYLSYGEKQYGEGFRDQIFSYLHGLGMDIDAYIEIMQEPVSIETANGVAAYTQVADENGISMFDAINKILSDMEIETPGFESKAADFFIEP